MIYNEKHSVRFSLPDQEEQRYEKADLLEIYRKIRNKEPLCLRGIVLEGFSVKAYREYYHLSADEIIRIEIDSISNCLFLVKDGISLDLSGCILEASDAIAGILLEDNIFYERLIFQNVALMMWTCHLREVISGMLDCILILQSLEKMIFIWIRQIFMGRTAQSILSERISERAVSSFFSYMSGLKGMVEFYRCDFGENMLDFAYMNCPECQFIFWDLETPSVPIDFVDSRVRMIILYKVNVNGVLDFRIQTAEDIIIQESVIRDCVLLGNQGYKNYTSYCLKKSTLLGRLKIQNKFSKKLFSHQKQLVCDTRTEENEIVFCQTSSTDKANQLTILAENYHSEGEADNEDRAYVLSKRYRSRGRVHDIWTDYGAAAWLYSLQIFLQIDSGDLLPQMAGLYCLMVGEKIIGLMMFSIFVVSYTRKVIK